MSDDVSGLRQLLGVMPNARLALLGSLLHGVSAVEDLVAVSGLPRRDVEEFLGSLPAGFREQYGHPFGEYVRQRPVVGPDREGDLERAARVLIDGVPAPRKRLDHVQATARTLVRRVKWLTDVFDLRSRAVLFLGDHDVTSLLLARVVPDARITVTDIDERLLAYVDEQSAPGARVDCVFCDLRFGLPPALAQSADVVFTDPPYTPEGLSLFLSRSVAALDRHSLDNRVVLAYGHSRRRPDLAVAAQREILRQDLAIDCMIPGFNGYAGAQAVGSVSDLYSCQPASRAFRRADSESRELGIYTHGGQSAESRARSAGGLVPSLPRITQSGLALPRVLGMVSPDPGTARDFGVTISLAKLIGSGVHASVTGRAEEVVVDLRDDPGPWLMRSMLALNAPRATFVVGSRHEAADGLNAGAPEWDLVRDKFGVLTVSPVPGEDLTAVRCVLADAAADQPPLRLTRFVLRRAHGRLRNVWREGLVELAAGSGKTLTKREAADLASSCAASGAGSCAGSLGSDLALRLIDVPAHHFPRLREALRASAAAVA